jgi:diguanylate cyclase (GGDEF)-like protein
MVGTYLLLITAVFAMAFIAILALRRRRAADRQRAQMLSELEARLDTLAQNLREIVARASQPSTFEEGSRALPSVTASAATAEAEAAPPDGVGAAETSWFAPTKYYYAIGEDRPDVVGPSVSAPLEMAGRGDERPVPGDDLETLEQESESGPGLGDRATFHRTLSMLVADAHAQGRRLAICMLDLDAFKLVNEQIGVLAADEVLAEIADVLRQTVRPTDLVFRTGGDEFSVILPDSGRIDAESLFARLQARLANRDVVQNARVSLSAGITQLETDEDGISLFARAGRALRDAKDVRARAPA